MVLSRQHDPLSPHVAGKTRRRTRKRSKPSTKAAAKKAPAAPKPDAPVVKDEITAELDAALSQIDNPK